MSTSRPSRLALMMSSEMSWFCWMNFATPSGSSSTFMADCAARSAEMRASRSAFASSLASSATDFSRPLFASRIAFSSASLSASSIASCATRDSSAARTSSSILPAMRSALFFASSCLRSATERSWSANAALMSSSLFRLARDAASSDLPASRLFAHLSRISCSSTYSSALRRS